MRCDGIASASRSDKSAVSSGGGYGVRLILVLVEVGWNVESILLYPVSYILKTILSFSSYLTQAKVV
jgi:hypothetical protein